MQACLAPSVTGLASGWWACKAATSYPYGSQLPCPTMSVQKDQQQMLQLTDCTVLLALGLQGG